MLAKSIEKYEGFLRATEAQVEKDVEAETPAEEKPAAEETPAEENVESKTKEE
jgi:hypothetical protein